MVYKVITRPIVLKYLNRLPKNISEQFLAQIKSLAANKSGYRKLAASNNLELWELRVSSHRIYYLVHENIITVDIIPYQGIIDALDAGHKNHQQRQIKSIVKDFKLREEGAVYEAMSFVHTVNRAYAQLERY